MNSKFLEVDFGSRKVKFYPLTIGQIQELEEEMKVLMGVGRDDFVFSPDRFAKLQRLYTASAKRGDPSITEDDIRAVVDLGNVSLVNKAVLGQTFGELKEGEEGTPTSPRIGGSSTLVS